MAPQRIQPRINFSSSLILAGQYSAALGVLQQALETEPNHPLALNNKAVALYLYGKQENIETSPKALAILKELNKKHSLNFAKFNQSLIQSKPRQNLQLLESGPLYDRVEQKTSDSAIRSPLKSVAPGNQAIDFFASPIPLGVETTLSSKKLNALKPWQNFILGELRGAILYSNSIKALVSMDPNYKRTIEIVEVPLKQPFSKEQLLSNNGAPLRVVQNALSQTWVYANFAVDLENDRPLTIVYYISDFLGN